MSWKVDRDQWLEAATQAPSRAPLRSVLDEVDGRLCGMLGFDLRPPDPGAVSAEIPTIHSGEIISPPPDEPRTGDEPLEIEVSPASARGPVGEALSVELAPGDVAAEPGAMPTPAPVSAVEDDDAAPRVEEDAAPEEERTEAERTEAEPVDEAVSAAPTETLEAPEEDVAEVDAPSSEAEAETEAETEAQTEIEAEAQAETQAAGPAPTDSSPSLFMPASLLRPSPAPEDLEPDEFEEVASPEPDEEARAVPEPIERVPSEELDAADVVEEAELIEAAELVEEAAQPPDAPAPSHPPAAPSAAPPKPPSPPPRRRNWFDDVFTEHFATLSPDGVEESAGRDVEFVLSIAELPQESTILDVGCGIGHHALRLAELGYRVTGVDFSLAQLLRASELNEERQAGVSFLHGDMRGLPTDDEFDLVTCLGSTLGYFEEDTNRQALEEMRDRVKPGGRMVLHVFNRDYLVSKLPIRSWWQGNKCLVLDEAELNYKANRLRVHRTIVFEDGRQFEHYMFLRAYSVHDLGKMLSAAGLKVISLSGSRETRGRFYGSASPDIWIVAERRVSE